MLAILLTAGAYIYRAPTERWDQFVAWIKMFTTTDIAKLDSPSAIPGVSGIVILGLVAKIIFSLRAFGANPAALMASTSNQFKVRDASAQAGFRFQFQRDFQEVTNALKQINKRMLIFIDDLDRCQPEKVSQILEAVNFLTSSGNCYIVLGMDRDYVEAARASGANAFTIVRVHVLGNVLGPIFVYATSLIAVSMILASGLSFLGLGVKPPEPEWGLMLNTLRTAIYVQPWVAALPGAMIFITSIAFNMLSDALRSAMDVK